MNTWRTLLAAVAGLALLNVPAQAQNFEYVGQPNLDQIMVTPGLHDQLDNLFSSSAQSAAIMNAGIATLDGRADELHVDLSGRTSVTLLYPGFYLKDVHGTHVTGIAGATRNNTGIVGVNPFARLLNIPVFDLIGFKANDLAKAALDSAVAQNAKAANMSYGPTTQGDVFLPGELDVFDDYASSLVLVRAAGNDGVWAKSANYSGDAVANLAHLLIVGSVDSANRLSSFSNKPGLACMSQQRFCGRNNPDAMMNFFIVAPGDGIVSDLPGDQYGALSGTSMAAPHVAGAAVLVYQQALAGNTELSPGEIASILKESATDLGFAGVDWKFGWGLLNVEAALAPVGGTFLATGDTVNGGLQPMSGARLRKSSVMGKSARLDSALSGVVLFDRYKRPFTLKQAPVAQRSSDLVERSVQELTIGLAERRESITQGDTTMALVASGDATGSQGYSAMSLTSGAVGIQAGFGTARTYFAAGASDQAMGSSLYTLGSDFFAGSGDVGKDLAQALFAGADYQLAERLSVSALFVQTAPDALRDEFDPLADLEFADVDSSALVKFGLHYQLSDAISVSASYGLLQEEGRVLGIESDGALSLGDSAQTQLVGASIRARLSDRAALALFGEVSQTTSDLDQTSLFSEVEGWRGSKFGVSLEWSELFSSNDVVRLALARPWTIDSGTLSGEVPVGRELDGTVVYESRKVSLAGSEVPAELSLAYQNRNEAFSYGAGLTMFSGDVRSFADPEVAVTAGFQWAF